LFIARQRRVELDGSVVAEIVIVVGTEVVKLLPVTIRVVPHILVA